MKNSIVSQAYLVAGQPHILLAHDKAPAWNSLFNSYAKLREEIEKSDADLILYFSTQWLSVIGWLFQADPQPKWTYVDHNWYDYGSLPYQFKVDAEFGKVYADEVRKAGEHAATVNYKGFPIDAGSIVAQRLLNPDNRLPAAMVSCNMYAEKEETMRIGLAGARALERAKKKAIVVLVSNLSNRYFTHEIDPREDKISSAKDHEWNLKIVELLGEGRLEDVAQVAREFSKQANADQNFKGIWWLNALCGQSNDFKGRVFDYQPVWGTGAALIGLTPTKPVRPGEEISSGDDHDYGAPEKSADTDATKKNARPPAEAEAGAVLHSKKAPEPVGPYPHARREGDRIYVSGIGPRKRDSKEIPGVTLDKNGKIVSHDVEIQTRSCIENIKTILEEAGSSLEAIIDVQVFLTDMAGDFQKFNKVYAEYFEKIGPTRTTVGVTALPTPIAVELKVIARA